MERETKKSLNIEQIQQIIPHRHPFCLIDRIEAISEEIGQL